MIEKKPNMNKILLHYFRKTTKAYNAKNIVINLSDRKVKPKNDIILAEQALILEFEANGQDFAFLITGALIVYENNVFSIWGSYGIDRLTKQKSKRAYKKENKIDFKKISWQKRLFENKEHFGTLPEEQIFKEQATLKYNIKSLLMKNKYQLINEDIKND